MTFYSEITLPESGQSCKISQITFNDYYTLNKFLQNNIDTHINDALFTILKKYTNVQYFTGLDAAIALLFLRVISISPTLNLKLGNIEYKHEIPPLLKVLTEIEINPIDVSFNNIKINIKTPSKLYGVQLEDFIHSGTIDDINHIFTEKERQDICKHLPASIIKSIEDYSDQIEQKLSKITFKVINTDVECGLNNGTLFELIKMFFKDNIRGCQRRLISIANHTELSTEYVVSLPPAEVEMLLSFIEEQQSKQSAPTTPNIPRGPVP